MVELIDYKAGLLNWSFLLYICKQRLPWKSSWIEIWKI